MSVIAAVYARKSTDQLGLTDEQKSVTRQVQHARAGDRAGDRRAASRRRHRKRCERALLELDAAARIGQRDLSRLGREIRHLADWRAMLWREVPEAREILRNLVVGRTVFTPRPETRLYEFSGWGSLGRLLAGTAGPVSVVTPGGSARLSRLPFEGAVEVA